MKALQIKEIICLIISKTSLKHVLKPAAKKNIWDLCPMEYLWSMENRKARGKLTARRQAKFKML